MTPGRSGESVVAADIAVNQVRLAGRVAAVPEERDLPSGDRVVTLRLVVPRNGKRRSPNSPTVDTIEVACWSAATRRSALRLKQSDHAIVEGALRRRFFRSGVAVQSRYEVEAAAIRRQTAASAVRRESTESGIRPAAESDGEQLGRQRGRSP